MVENKEIGKFGCS